MMDAVDAREMREILAKELTPLHAKLANAYDEETVIEACRAAEHLIISGGYGPEDSDMIGSEMSDHVHALLVMAILLQPSMMNEWRDNEIIP